MFKKILLITAALWASVAMAATDVNKASAAELDSVKGVGPALSSKIVDERKKGEFKSWDDFMQRVKGVREARATKLSAEGLTINGESFKGAAKAPAKAKAEKAARGGDKPAAQAARP